MTFKYNFFLTAPTELWNLGAAFLRFNFFKEF